MADSVPVRFHPRGGASASAPLEHQHQQHTPPNSGGDGPGAARASPALTDFTADDARPGSLHNSPALSRSGSPPDGRHHHNHHHHHHHHPWPVTHAGAALPPSDRSVTSEPAYDLANNAPPAMPSIAYLTSSPGSHVSPRFHHERSLAEAAARPASSPHPSSYPQQHGSPASCSSGSFAGPPPPTSSSIIMQPGLLASDDGSCRRFPLCDVQEACLLRYFIEEMSHWVSAHLHVCPWPC